MTDDETSVVESQVDELLAGFGDLLTDIDYAKADINISSAPTFEIRMWAGNRMTIVRDANALRLQVAANKIVNPDKAKELEKVYNSLLWQIAAIDKLYPRAKPLCLEIMEMIAQDEQEAHNKKRQERRG